MKQLLLPLLVFLPMGGAILSYVAGRRSERARDALVALVCAVCLAMAGWGLLCTRRGETLRFAWEGFCGLGLHFSMEGFRAIYSLIACFMWLCTSLFSREYFLHHHSRSRYHLFSLLTMGATIGVFLAEDFYTLFIFFEIMSLSSYCLVAHEEDEKAMRAAQTYLAVAVGGGMVTLMGLFLLYRLTGTLSYDGLFAACARVENRSALYAAGALTCVGFAAKAGAFPLHIWLPKAHPVAPAPASALLSGILTKTGVFGLIAVSCSVFGHNAAWGNILLAFAMITMFLGALLALFSIDLKRTLACSSMSQIGFILFGVAVQALLSEGDGLAVYGTVMHMINHSLIKLALFMAAGAVYMKAHSLDLNEIRGYGRGKPALHFAFLMGAVGLAGVPLFNGFVSKSLLHEALLEYVAERTLLGEGTVLYRAVEWLFLTTGGLTAAYMTKLYVAIFWQKNLKSARQAEYDRLSKSYATPLSKAVLTVSAAALPVLGLFPSVFLQGAAQGAAGFFRSEGVSHAISYFSGENLLGAAESLSIAAVVYFAVVRGLLMKKGVYLNRWPAWLDLENLVYRPLVCRLIPGALDLVSRALGNLVETACRLLHPVAAGFAHAMDKAPEAILRAVRPLAVFAARLFDSLTDTVALALKRTLFRHEKKPLEASVGTRLTYALGCLLNSLVALANHTIFAHHPVKTDFTIVLAAGRDEMDSSIRRVAHSVSFGLLLTCIGLFLAFAYLILWR